MPCEKQCSVPTYKGFLSLMQTLECDASTWINPYRPASRVMRSRVPRPKNTTEKTGFGLQDWMFSSKKTQSVKDGKLTMTASCACKRLFVPSSILGNPLLGRGSSWPRG